MAARSVSYSIVNYSSDNDGYSCGYCKSPDTNFSHQMWVHSLLVQDYQVLLDRGWSRSGKHFYKPTMHLLCCPMYTIKCSTPDFKLSKSQRKVIKKMNRFLKTGEINGDLEFEKDCETGISVTNNDCRTTNTNSNLKSESNVTDNIVYSHETDTYSNKKRIGESGTNNVLKGSVCKKAKVLRLERKRQKLQSKGLKEEEIIKKLNTGEGSKEKSLEDLINEPLSENPAHRLKTVLVPAGSSEMNNTLAASYELYVKYQSAVHNQDPTDCSFDRFFSFLVHTPLKSEKPKGNCPPTGYGSFHEQYWLDEKLIAVGVLDILPKCVCSVYFYYDPDYKHLSLGTYSTLREISYTKSLYANYPSIQDYYMGYFIESSPKMNYKGRLKPSFLLCPETYSWQPFEEARHKIQKCKYSRLNDDLDAIDEDGIVDVDSVTTLFENIGMSFKMYKSKTACANEELVREYASLVGMTCARRMYLIRK